MADRLPPLHTVRAFVAAGRHASFTRAADELGVTHGAISKQIRLLEEHLGLPLFTVSVRFRHADVDRDDVLMISTQVGVDWACRMIESTGASTCWPIAAAA